MYVRICVCLSVCVSFSSGGEGWGDPDFKETKTTSINKTITNEDNYWLSLVLAKHIIKPYGEVTRGAPASGRKSAKFVVLGLC